MALRQYQLYCNTCGESRVHTQQVPNHGLHIALTVFTFGFWVIPWVLLSMNAKPARCSACGTERPGQSQFQLESSNPQPLLLPAPQLTAAVDQALQKIKGPLKTTRSKHGIVGDVTFRLRYEPSGTIVGVTIDNGPPNITPGFISDSTTIIKGMLVLPVNADGGVMLFTDLDADAAPYR